MVYNRQNKSINHAIFKDLFHYIPKTTAFILNDTKVIKARIFGHKQSGGKVEILLNSIYTKYSFKAYIRGKVHVGTVITLQNNTLVHVENILDDGMRIVKFTCKKNILHVSQVYELLESIGHVPLPPYIKREDTQEDVLSYQSLFAKKEGAVAAPTASLHFTQHMLEVLKKKYSYAYITLHVGAGTFKPIESEDIKKHIMHEEYFSLSNEALNIIKSNQKILAVGTTVTRTIEYYIREKKKDGWCDLFLHPLNPPKRVDFLLTNFHLPKSTLLMLVASFIGLDATMKIYHEAIEKEYKFYSYGDAMLII